MLKVTEISGIKFEVDNRLRKYIIRKVGRLDKYLPRHARDSASATVKLREANGDHGNKYEAEIILQVPDKVISAKDSTLNMYAAIDIVEAKIINQVRKYKQTSVLHVSNRSIMSRFKRSFGREAKN